MMRASFLLAGLCLAGFSISVYAHHGVAGIGAAALQGPGAPIESASSAVLPQGKMLWYGKLDSAHFKTYDPDPAAPESRYAHYWMAGLGYGFTPWFSAYVFAPYHVKVDEPGGLNSRGWADMSVLGQFGFKHEPGEGLKRLPASESLDDLEDWHFTVFFGVTLPTGNANHRLADGSIDPAKALGFGRNTWNVGVSASKVLTPRLTLNAELSAMRFREYTYADGQRIRFGPEDRLNLSFVRRMHMDVERRWRLDGVLEAQYLRLGRDVEDGAAAAATGGRILYLLPGARLYKDNLSLALGVKKPVWTRLHEAADQQGAEGKEKYRWILSVSALF